VLRITENSSSLHSIHLLNFIKALMPENGFISQVFFDYEQQDSLIWASLRQERAGDVIQCQSASSACTGPGFDPQY
jgi:hypothetical protein